MAALPGARRAWRRGRAWIADWLASDDPLAAVANTGALVVWSNQPFYPIYVWLLVGRDAWPALLTWLSTPVFVAVAPVSRRHPLAARVLFTIAGVLNTLLSAKAFGTETSVGWFLAPCAILALGFFRGTEWRPAAAMAVLVAAAALALSHLGAPLHAYAPAAARSLARLNIYSVCALSAYLLWAAVRARRPASPAASS